MGMQQKFDLAKMHLLQNSQGDIVLAQSDQLFWTSIEGELLPLQGYRDLGRVLDLWSKLAQYRHARKVLLEVTQYNLQDNIKLFREIE